MRADFGTRYETRYEGNDHYDSSTLDGVLDLEDETDRTPNHLVQKFVDFYVKHGFLDAEVEARDARHAGAIAIELPRLPRDRGPARQVAARSYPCLREDDVKKLSEGGPTSARAIGSEIDSYLEEELPGSDLIAPPEAGRGSIATIARLARRHAARARRRSISSRARAYVARDLRARRAARPGALPLGGVPLGAGRARAGHPSSLQSALAARRVHADARAGTEPGADVCTYDAIGLPLPVPPLEHGATCVPDPAHGIECEPRVWLRIPVKLGPRTQLWDVAFAGARGALARDARRGRRREARAVREHGEARGGAPARRRCVQGGGLRVRRREVLARAVARSHARARALRRLRGREGHRPRRSSSAATSSRATAPSSKRIALVVGQPYRASLVRKTEERIATLGAFSTRHRRAREPVRPAAEQDGHHHGGRAAAAVHRGRARLLDRRRLPPRAPSTATTTCGATPSQLTLRLQLAYIPTPLIIDPVARDNYRNLNDIARLGVRATAGVVFPEIGLGPLVRAGVDTILVHDLQRDFYLTKIAAIPNMNYRPVSEVQITLFQSFEFNNSRIFQSGSASEYLTCARRARASTSPISSASCSSPTARRYAFSQRLLATWDRRDNAFNASRGTYVVSGIEHVDALPDARSNLADARARGQPAPPESHFFKLTQTFGGYIPLPKGMRIAALTRLGVNMQLTDTSQTYPDRLFFMGGVDTMRGWTLNSFIPQDNVDRIYASKDSRTPSPDPHDPAAQIPNAEQVHAEHAADPRRQPDGERAHRARGSRSAVRSRPSSSATSATSGSIRRTRSRRARSRCASPSARGVRVQTPVGPLAVDYGFNVTQEVVRGRRRDQLRDRPVLRLTRACTDPR